MPRRSVRTRKRTMGVFSFLIGLTVVAAVGLICAIVIKDRLTPKDQDNVAPAPTDGVYVDAKNMPETQMTLRASSFSDEYLSTPTPDADSAAAGDGSQSADVEDPYAALSSGDMKMDLLPVYKKADTEDKVIAITLDECAGEKITTAFIKLAMYYDAKLTLFPTGDNVMKSGMSTILKKCVFELGYEIENRGYSDFAKLYQYIDNLMVSEVWKQSIAVNFALGVKYQPHFYRMYGGLGESDPRTNAYLKQEGYLGFAHWTVACSYIDPKDIPSKLTPGGVYSFRSTVEDGQRMYMLMKAAKDAGYRMVTMNELFGLPANEYHQVEGSLLAETMPSFHYDASNYYNLYSGDVSWAVALLQNRLSQLGYLPENSSDGIFGEATANGVRLFQAEIGRAASGVADVVTQKALFAVDAPKNPRPLETPVPEFASGGSKNSAGSGGSDGDDSSDGFQFSALMDDGRGDAEDADPGNPFVDNGVEEE